MAKRKFHLDKHILIPKHTKLSDKEKQQLFERYRIRIKEIPKISKKDPAISKLNAKAGDIIKIVRGSSTSGETVFYRGVIND